MFFFIWLMVATLPYYIFSDGFEKLNKWLAKRGRKITALELWIIILVIVAIILWTAGFR
jgi:hypothetical protein